MLRTVDNDDARAAGNPAAVVTTRDDDETLVKRIQDGDTRAEAQLIERHKWAVRAILMQWRVGGAVERSDLFQETWIIVIVKIRQREIHSPEFIRYFIAATARLVLKGARRYEQRREHESDEKIPLVSDMPSARVMMDVEQRDKLVREFLDQLTASHAQLLRMYFVWQFSREEICQTMQISKKILSSRIYHAKTAFRKLLDERAPGAFDDHWLE